MTSPWLSVLLPTTYWQFLYTTSAGLAVTRTTVLTPN